MNVKMRQRIERSIVRRIVLDALAAGYKITVDSGEEQVTPEQKVRPILAAMFTVDDEWLLLRKPEEKGGGWVRLIYGNDGPDVINDYSIHLEDLLKGANALADKYDD